MYVIVYCCSCECFCGPRFSCSFYRMVLDDFGINLTENKGKNDTNISTVDPCTEDQPQDQTIWLTIKIAIAVIVVIGLFVIGLIIVKKRKWLRGKMMGLIGVI